MKDGHCLGVNSSKDGGNSRLCEPGTVWNAFAGITHSILKTTIRLTYILAISLYR